MVKKGVTVNSKLLGVGITAALIILLVFMALGTKKGDNNSALSELKSVRELISKDKLDEARASLDDIANINPDLSILGRIYFGLAEAYEKKDNIVNARDTYEVILAKYQNVDNIGDIQQRLGRLNMDILFSPIITDKDVRYKVEPGDTLSKIAKKYRTTVDLIKRSNLLKDDTIRAHSKLKVSTAKYNILIDKSQNILTLLSGGDTITKAYKVSTGKNNSTPVGTFDIVNRIKDPVWYAQGAIVPAESPKNILGSRWLGLSERGYGIHGTTEPESLGQQSTQGCIRMLNEDVEELYTIIPIGTRVTIVD